MFNPPLRSLTVNLSVYISLLQFGAGLTVADTPKSSVPQTVTELKKALTKIESDTATAIRTFHQGRFSLASEQFHRVQQKERLLINPSNQKLIEAWKDLSDHDTQEFLHTDSSVEYYLALLQLYVTKDFAGAEKRFKDAVDETRKAARNEDIGLRGPALAQFDSMWVFNLAKAQLINKKYTACLNTMKVEVALARQALDDDMDLSDDEMDNLRELAFFRTNDDLDVALTLNTVVPEQQRSAVTSFTASLTVERKSFIIDVIGRFLQRVRATGTEAQMIYDHLEAVRAEADAIDPIRKLKSSISDVDSYKSTGVDHRLEKLEEEEEDLREQLSRMISEDSNAKSDPKLPVSPTIEYIEKRLHEGEILVQYVEYRPYDPFVDAHQSASIWADPEYAAYVVIPHKNIRFVPLGPVARIDSLIASIRSKCGTRGVRGGTIPGHNPGTSRGELKDELATLYKLVLLPTIGDRTNWKLLYVVPDGQMNLIPFSALVNQNGQFAIESGPILYLTNANELGNEHPHRESTEAVVIANPSFGSLSEESSKSGNGRLPAGFNLSFTDESIAMSADEAHQIAGLLIKPTVLEGENASEDKIKHLASPAIVHVASHGFFVDSQRAPLKLDAVVDQLSLKGVWSPRDSNFAWEIEASNPWLRQFALGGRFEDPLLYSGVALAGANARREATGDDGILTAREVLGLNLQGTDLFVLSACDTAVGQISQDSFYGFRRALALAGARNAVLSLWPVRDDAAHDVMISFYKRLAQGDSIAQALQTVQVSEITRPIEEWASFIAGGVDGHVRAGVFKETVH